MTIVNIYENNAKNYAINGSFEFFQRKVIAVAYPSSFGYVGPDRLSLMWAGTAWTVAPTVERSSLVPDGKGLRNSLLSIGTPSNVDNTISHRYRIEAREAKEIADKGSMSLSAFFRSDNYTSIDVQVNYATVEDDFTSVTLIDDLNETIVADDSFQPVTKFANIAIPSNAKNGIEIIIKTTAVSTGSVSNFYIAGLMINKGEASIAYKQAGFSSAKELQLCKRYYEQFVGKQKFTGSHGSSSVVAYATVRFRVEKRISPTLLYSATGDFKSVADNASESTVSSFSNNSSNTEFMAIQYNTSVSDGAYRATAFYGNVVGAWLAFDAEL